MGNYFKFSIPYDLLINYFSICNTINTCNA